MQARYAFAMGYRYTRSSRKSGLLSFLSSVSMAGLIIGVSLLVTVLSVMNGFERELRERILGLLPQASIYQAGGLADWPALAQDLNQIDGVSATAPFIQVDALISYRNRAEPVVFYGIDVDEEKRVSLIPSFVEESILSKLDADKRGILLGVEIAERLQIKPGTNVMLIAPGNNRSKDAQIEFFHVLALVRSNSQLDQTLALANIEGLRLLKPDRAESVDGLRLKFERLDAAPYIAGKIARELGPTFYQSNWQRTHGNLYHAIQMSKKMIGLLMSLVVALAAFNIVSTMILVVTEKQSNIAILRTLGASSKEILFIFLSQGFFIGVGGTLLGIGLGCLFVVLLQPFVTALERLLGAPFLHSDVYPLTEIPAQISLIDLAGVGITSITLVFFASLYPAWRASRTQPAEVLRYE